MQDRARGIVISAKSIFFISVRDIFRFAKIHIIFDLAKRSRKKMSLADFSTGGGDFFNRYLGSSSHKKRNFFERKEETGKEFFLGKGHYSNRNTRRLFNLNWSLTRKYQKRKRQNLTSRYRGHWSLTQTKKKSRRNDGSFIMVVHLNLYCHR